MVTDTKPQQRKKEESEGLREERGIRSSLLILDSNDGKSQDLGQQEGKTFHKLHVVGMNDDLWDKFRGLGNETTSTMFQISRTEIIKATKYTVLDFWKFNAAYKIRNE